MSKQIFYGKNVNNTPVISHANLLKDVMRSFGDQYFQLTIERRVKKRSNSQSNYYWGCCIPAVIDGLVENGYPRNELSTEIVHLMLREKFLRSNLVSDQGEVISRIKSTTELSTVQFMEFIADIQQWSAEILNIFIPDPNTQSEISFK